MRKLFPHRAKYVHTKCNTMSVHIISKFIPISKYFREINVQYIFLVRVEFTNFCQESCSALWKNKKFFLARKIIRQINSLVISLVQPLISRNFCQNSLSESKFLYLISTLCTAWKSRNFTATIFAQKFRKIIL